MADSTPIESKSSNGQSPVTAAVDLGGTNVRAAVVNNDGVILAHDRIPTPTGDPDTGFLQSLVGKVCAEVDIRPDRAVVGLPGVIDHEADKLVAAPNLPQHWIPDLTESKLQEQLGCLVGLANDADLAAVGEATFGAGRTYRDVVYITISTGVGAGVVVGGQLVKGRLSGGEIGHTVVDFLAGQRGEPATVEEIGSGTAIAAAAAAAGLSVTGADFDVLVRSGDETANAIWRNAITAVGFGLANLAWIVPPQVIVIGGGVGRNHDLIAPIVREQLKKFGPIRADEIVVASAELGDEAALVGAPAWWQAVGKQVEASS